MWLPQWLRGKESAYSTGDPWIRKIPWRRAWQPTPVFLPGESMDRGAWWATVHRLQESDTTEATEHTHTNTQTEELATTCIKAYALHRFSDGAHLSAVT